MRNWTVLLLLSLGLGTAYAQELTCTERAKKWQVLLQDNQFNEMDAWVTASLKACPIETFPEIHHQAAMTYLWRGKLEQARPVVEKLTARASESIRTSRTASAFGLSNYLPFILAVYSGADDKVEEYLSSYDTSFVKFQEQALIFLLRNNDKRFPNFYASRKQTKNEYLPILCRMYCKKNGLKKDCPCSTDPAPKPKGGAYALYQEYLDGKPADQIKADVQARYAEAPFLKREVLECLGLK